MAAQVAFAIAHCSSPSDPTLEALVRTRRYLRSIGRYGSGAFLVGQYGGAGEIAQGFCRYVLNSSLTAEAYLTSSACAVFGGTYVLGKESIPESITIEERSVKLILPCHPRPITAKHLITSPDHLLPDLRGAESSAHESTETAHCVAVLSSLPDALRRPKSTKGLEEGDAGDDEEDEDDTAVVVFPPTGDKALVRALIMGEGTGSCPSGQCKLSLLEAQHS